MTDISPLRLVTAYRESDYFYPVSRAIDDPLNSTSVQTAQMILKGAINLARLSDYKLFTEWGKVTARFPTYEDSTDCEEALSDKERLHWIFGYDNPMPAKEIRRRCKDAEVSLNEKFAGDIQLKVRTGRKIIVLSGHKASYFAAKRADPMSLIFGAEPH